MQANSEEFRALLEAGMKYSGRPTEEPEPEEEKVPFENHPQGEFIKSMLEAGMMYDGSISDRPNWGKLPDEIKIKLCTHKTGIGGIRKLPDGTSIRVPNYCNLCPDCYKANAEKIKRKIENISIKIKEKVPEGKWRLKVVDEKTEAQSLKKRISRNQGKRHIELANDQSDKSDMYVYAVNEPGKTEEQMTEAYGKVVDDPISLDFDKLYERTRESGKKVSIGGGFRNPVPKKNDDEDKERVLIPEAHIKNIEQMDEAEKIFDRVNYMEKVESASEFHRLFLLQFKYIMKELERAGIEVTSVKRTYIYMTEKEMIEQWNRNVDKWLLMSDNASLSLGDEPKMDKDDELTKYLVFPQ